MVFDEADLLLSGGYGAQMRIIWDALRSGDRLHAARRTCLEVRRRLLYMGCTFCTRRGEEATRMPPLC